MESMDWEEVIVPREKLVDYLLSLTHPIGKSKAQFFRKHGFDEAKVSLLEQGFRDLVVMGTVQKEIRSSYGTKLVIDGKIETPQGKSVNIRSVWIADLAKRNLQFITAYPLE